MFKDLAGLGMDCNQISFSGSNFDSYSENEFCDK